VFSSIYELRIVKYCGIVKFEELKLRGTFKEKIFPIVNIYCSFFTMVKIEELDCPLRGLFPKSS